MPTVLIIEEDSVTSAQFADILTLAGYEIVAAHDLRSALDHLATQRVAVILFDWQPPDASAVDGLRAIRALGHCEHVPILVVTGNYFLDDTVPEQLERLKADVRFKPIWADELVELIGHMLGINR